MFFITRTMKKEKQPSLHSKFTNKEAESSCGTILFQSELYYEKYECVIDGAGRNYGKC